MKKIIITIMTTLALCACGSDPEPVDRQAYEAKKAFEAMYLKHMYGEWQNQMARGDGSTVYEERLWLRKDNSYRHETNVKEQASGHISNSSTSTGTWHVVVQREDDGRLKPHICLDETLNNGHTVRYVPCSGADENTLFVVLPPFDRLKRAGR